jgi:hypothetical protein
LLSKKIAEVKLRAAMAPKDIPAFVATLGDEVESRALGARWREFDLDNREWIVPSERMKMNRDHAVPLHGFRSTLSTWAEDQDDGRA